MISAEQKKQPSYLDQFKFVKNYTENWRDSVVNTDSDLIEKYSGFATEVLQNEINIRKAQGEDVGDEFIKALAKNGQDIEDGDLETSGLLDRVTTLTSERLGIDLRREDVKYAILQKFVQDTIQAQQFSPDRQDSGWFDTPVNMAAGITGTIADDLSKSPVSGLSDAASSVIPYGVGFYLGYNTAGKHLNPLGVLARAVGGRLLGFGVGVASAVTTDKVLEKMFPNKLKEELGIPSTETSIWEEIKNYGMVELGLTALSWFFPLLRGATLIGSLGFDIFKAFKARSLIPRIGKAVADSGAWSQIGKELTSSAFWSKIFNASTKYMTILGKKIFRNPLSTALGVTGIAGLAVGLLNSDEDEEYINPKRSPAYINDQKVSSDTFRRELSHIKELQKLEPTKYNVNFAKNLLNIYDDEQNIDIISRYVGATNVKTLKRELEKLRRHYEDFLQ